MAKKEIDMLALEQEIASVESDALTEERDNAKDNYERLDRELQSIIIPYPDVNPFDTGFVDYEEKDVLNYKKSVNKPYWDRQDALRKYCDNGSLYSGHVRTVGGRDYYIMDAPFLESKKLDEDGYMRLVNSDDQKFADIVRGWHYPDENKNIEFSRNITMASRLVSAVDVVMDNGSSVFSGITDAYLRKALVRNKSKPGMQSIIQTIQRKQDDIRSLPTGESFIVQGCAGSGKTMVLLHRLRYLIYNKEISSGDYVLLVPSNNFKNFIKDISAQFRISFKAIFPYQAYYQMMLGKSGEVPDEDVSELVFDKQYLSRVYSKTFMQESYKALFDVLLNQTDGLIELCENKLNELLEFEALIIDEEAETAKMRAVTEAKTASERVCNFISADITGFDDIPRFQKELNDAYDAAKTEYETVTDPNFRIVISPDDDRILNNSKLSQLREHIEAEKEIIKKASFFTAAAHKSKLAILQNEYDEAYKAVEKELEEEDKRAYAERAARSAYVFEGVTLGETKRIIEELAALYSGAAEQISEAESKKYNLTEHLMEKFSREISDLNKLVGLSAEILQWRKYAVSNLKPAIGLFKQLMAAGEELIESFCKHFTDSENKLVNDRYKSFSVRTEKQNEAYLNTRLLNICRKKIKDEFGVKLCKLYKHNWYLELYCQYLTRDTKWNRRQYIFMDEAQDLSVSELELINKINSYSEDAGEFHIAYTPVINVFGDVNQMITEHGIRTWDSVDFISDRYELDENFRNPNQIVDFCNSRLPYKMQKIGVDMEPVGEYKTIDDAIKNCPDICSGAVFVVKDEYAEEDLKHELAGKDLRDYTVYTVKSVKGLEFKEIFVFDRGMCDNEKYIAYSRALAKLNVISSLPRVLDPATQLYVDGEDTAEE